jgi:hypothetical protein
VSDSSEVAVAVAVVDVAVVDVAVVDVAVADVAVVVVAVVVAVAAMSGCVVRVDHEGDSAQEAGPSTERASNS